MSVRIRELVIKADLTQPGRQDAPAVEKHAEPGSIERKVTLVEEFYRMDSKKHKER